MKLLETEEYQETCAETPFLYLTCDLPPPPLYPDGLQENIIPQIPIYNVLNKFNGISEKEYKTHKDSTMRRFVITRLPPFIILYFKVIFSLFINVESSFFFSLFQRFTKNTFILEKNPTIVNFPVK